jgi:hypothetical protein
MAVSSLSYPEFSRILSQFDQRNFGIPLPTNTQERTNRQIALNQFPLSPIFPKDVINLLGLQSVNSVSELFMVYRTSPSLKGRTHFLNTSDIYLDYAAEKVLRAYEKLYNPDELEFLDLFFDQRIRSKQTPLPHFNKLMTHVLMDHLDSLPIEDQLRFKYKILNAENSSISVFRDKTALYLRLLLWKVQTVIGKISFAITHSPPATVLFWGCFGVAILTGMFSVPTRVQKYFYNGSAERCALFIFHNVQIPVFKKCVSILKLTLEYHQTEFIFKIMYIFSRFISAILPLIVAMPVLVVMGHHSIPAANFLINYGLNTMSPAAILAKKVYHLHHDFDYLAEKWHELCLN